MPKNLIQHHEWNTREPKRLKAFYSKIFDWKFDDRTMPGYTLIEGIGGVFEATPDMPTGIINYVNVEDLGAKEKLILAAGGKIYKSKQEVPGMGWFTIFADPDGNTIAMWQPMMKRPAKSAAKKSSKKSAAKKSAAKRKRR